MEIKLDPGAIFPTRGHADDAGLDLYTREKATILPGNSYIFDTGVHIAFPQGTFGKIESKSGLNVKHSVVSCGGVIDSGYTGSITVKLYNLSKDPYTFEKGDKIAQIVVQPCEHPPMVLVNKLNDTERGDGGFGSTGR